MINIPEEAKAAFLTDSVNKKINISVCNPDDLQLDELNYYKGQYTWIREYDINLASGLFDTIITLTNHVDLRGISLLKYIRVSLYLKISNITSNPGTMHVRCTAQRMSGEYLYLDSPFSISAYTTDFAKLNFTAVEAIDNSDPIKSIIRLEFYNTGSVALKAYIQVKNIQVEMADETSDLLAEFSKYYSISYDLTEFSNTFEIRNANIEFEKFSLTESLCSQDNIKFGLCESAHCETTLVGVNEDLNGRLIKPDVRVPGEPTLEALLTVDWWKDMNGNFPKGAVYTWDRTSKGPILWTDMAIFDTDLMPYEQYLSRATYISQGWKLKINSVTGISGNAPASFNVGMTTVFADGYERTSYGSIKHPFSEAADFAFFSLETRYINATHGRMIKVVRPSFKLYDANNNELTYNDNWRIDFEIKEPQVYMYNDPTWATPIPSYDPNTTYIYDGTFDVFLSQFDIDVPLGVFKVSDVKLEHAQNLIKKSITAYDRMVLLEQNAYNWYTQYMFGYNTEEYVFQTYKDVQYGRQIFAAYFNFMEQIGLENRNNYTETLIAFYDYWNDIKNTAHVSNKYLKFSTATASYSTVKNQYAVFQVNDIDSDKMYMVDAVNYEGWDDEAVLEDVVSAYESWDSLKRGIATNGGVLVEMYDSSNNLLDGFCFNRRDYFMIVPNTSYIKVYVPLFSVFYNGELNQRFIDSVSIYSIDSAPQLVNGFERLLYYKYVNQYGPNDTAIVNNSNSSITGRDVVRSLLEPCGCFFRLNRSTGKPEFIYCTKAGLYPRNDLYPAEDLYPRAGTDSLLANGRYMSVIQDNYQVKDFGKIQIVVNTNSSETRPVCQMEYTGSNKSPNTYLIDDNIFYSNENMDYEYQRAYDLLGRMYAMISNMGYVPNVTVALGMPWIECGDRVGVLTYIGGFESFIFRRTMKGIQLIEDTFEAVGDEYNEAVKEFGYETYN